MKAELEGLAHHLKATLDAIADDDRDLQYFAVVLDRSTKKADCFGNLPKDAAAAILERWHDIAKAEEKP